MIRKILFFIILVFTITWFAIAYTIKNNVVNLIKTLGSDDVKISYDHIQISGYPAMSWDVHIFDPKITINTDSGSTELFTEKLSLITDASFKKLSVVFSENIKQINALGGKTLEYALGDKFKLAVKFNKQLYRLSRKDRLSNLLKNIDLKTDMISVTRDEEELFVISDLSLLSHRKIISGTENISSEIHLSYNSQQEFFDFKTAKLDLLAHYNFNQLKKKDYDIIIEMLNFASDDASIALNGNVQIKDRIPNGKLHFSAINYNEIVDKLLPQNSFIPTKLIKLVLRQALLASLKHNVDNPSSAPTTIPQDVKFTLSFSKDGIKINSADFNDLLIDNLDPNPALEDNSELLKQKSLENTTEEEPSP